MAHTTEKMFEIGISDDGALGDEGSIGAETGRAFILGDETSGRGLIYKIADEGST